MAKVCWLTATRAPSGVKRLRRSATKPPKRPSSRARRKRGAPGLRSAGEVMSWSEKDTVASARGALCLTRNVGQYTSESAITSAALRSRERAPRSRTKPSHRGLVPRERDRSGHAELEVLEEARRQGWADLRDGDLAPRGARALLQVGAGLVAARATQHRRGDREGLARVVEPGLPGRRAGAPRTAATRRSDSPTGTGPGSCPVSARSLRVGSGSGRLDRPGQGAQHQAPERAPALLPAVLDHEAEAAGAVVAVAVAVVALEWGERERAAEAAGHALVAVDARCVVFRYHV